MEVFPERDGNWDCDDAVVEYHFDWSEWRSSLKGMETTSVRDVIHTFTSIVRMEVFPERDGNSEQRERRGVRVPSVRMEVFPERDGNVYRIQPPCSLILEMSEWRSSLKGMETTPSGRRVFS